MTPSLRKYAVISERQMTPLKGHLILWIYVFRPLIIVDETCAQWEACRAVLTLSWRSRVYGLAALLNAERWLGIGASL